MKSDTETTGLRPAWGRVLIVTALWAGGGLPSPGSGAPSSFKDNPDRIAPRESELAMVWASSGMVSRLDTG